MRSVLKDGLLLLILPAVILVIWWFASADSTSLYAPSLQLILWTFAQDWLGAGFFEHAIPSLVKFLAGFLIASIGGIAIGTLIGFSRRLSAALDPVIQFLRAIPPPALLPVALVIFGLGTAGNIAVIVIGAIWPTLMNTVDGIRSVDQEVRDMTRSYRLSLRKRLFSVYLPAASPQIFAGLRITLQLSIILIVVSEMFASTSGIGFYVLNSQQMFAVPETYAGTIVLGIIGFIATFAFVIVERRVLAWHRGMTILSSKG